MKSIKLHHNTTASVHNDQYDAVEEEIERREEEFDSQRTGHEPIVDAIDADQDEEQRESEEGILENGVEPLQGGADLT